MAPLRPLNHWMIQDDRIAREFDAILHLSPYYDPVRLSNIGADISFYAALTSNVNSPVGQINGNFDRNSEGIYRAPMGAALAIAGDDVSRHEYSEAGEAIGILMEPARTNKCTNFNANPDAALENHTVVGPGVFSRVQDAAALAAAGLSAICSSGYVFKLDNSGGGAGSVVYPEGVTGNTNAHCGTAYIYKDLASTGSVYIELEGSGNLEITNTDHFRRASVMNASPPNTSRLGIRTSPGAIAYWVLNQLEESPRETSPIITLGSATSRAIDILTYPTVDAGANPIINADEGMVAALWRPRFSKSDIAGVSSNDFQRILSLDRNWVWYRNINPNGQIRARANTNTDILTELAAPLQANQDYLVVCRWMDSEFYVGHKTAGAWVWSTPDVYTEFQQSGVMAISDLTQGDVQLSSNTRHVYLWRKNYGQQWLEDFFAGVAN